ncbi:hypothetical protein XBJ2_920037 [Xenorhabdus bovienii str. Jollieti]|uniref:Uncharacterized protein n=1 Tax=Xenorhabdus bovienii (strain SS-2004) TaxID=406818 RepID=D3V2G7_XENBS|nr:hypothetical protein XBJ1_1806 [Xenorhabdus bovienii SS-2004]CDH30623.1 hypothetical protein XBJ2_920037 [Xenorhabdus bovienii str. Jollieti]
MPDVGIIKVPQSPVRADGAVISENLSVPDGVITCLKRSA